MLHKEIIKKFFPKLKIENYEIITEGWESNVIIINNTIVFKFPKQNTIYDCVYKKEKIITDKIKTHITTKIPIIKIHKDNNITFVSMNRIDGVNFYKSKPDITNDLALFLKELHSIDIEELKQNKIINIFHKQNNLDAVNLPFFNFQLNLSNFPFNCNNLMEILKNHNLENDYNACIKTFTDFEYKEEDNVICHNDLHKGNIMVDGDKMSGIIDFGDSIYTNYNIEFISIFKWNEAIIIKIKNKYEELTGRKINVDFIISILKLHIYVKISNNINNINKNIEKLKLLDTLKRVLKNEDYDNNFQQLQEMFNSNKVISKG